MISDRYYDTLKEWFARYTHRFLDMDCDTEPIQLKIDHTARVCRETDTILDELAGDPQNKSIDRNTARITALLHDVGRFPQFRDYGTFADTKSTDHAALGLQVLDNEKILQPSMNDISEREVHLIRTAVAHHNKPQLPVTLTQEEMIYARLIRDADKLDIWHLLLKHYDADARNGSGAYVLGLPYADNVSPQVYRYLKDGSLVPYSLLQSSTDFKAAQLGWVHDLHFSGSFRAVTERRYLERLYATMPHSEEIQVIFALAQTHIRCKTR